MAGAPKGNRNAARGKLWRDALERSLAKACDGPERTVELGLDKLAEKLIQAAMRSEQWALLEVANRIDGKPAQSVTVGGDSDNPLVQRIERVLIDGNTED